MKTLGIKAGVTCTKASHLCPFHDLHRSRLRKNLANVSRVVNERGLRLHAIQPALKALAVTEPAFQDKQERSVILQLHGQPRTLVRDPAIVHSIPPEPLRIRRCGDKILTPIEEGQNHSSNAMDLRVVAYHKRLDALAERKVEESTGEESALYDVVDGRPLPVEVESGVRKPNVV